MGRRDWNICASASGAESARIAVFVREGKAPGLFWLGGFRSDMPGTKAERWTSGRRSTATPPSRFDYSGHGRSGGRLEDGTISRWLEEAEAVFDAVRGRPAGPGRLLHGRLAGAAPCEAPRRARRHRPPAGMVLIAPAVDMTKALMWDRFEPGASGGGSEQGFRAEPSAYSREPYVITRALMEDGEKHLFGEHPIETGCPVHVIQGMQDEDVPWQHATKLMERLAFDDAVLTLVRDGDHRLSRPEDIERLIGAVSGMVEG